MGLLLSRSAACKLYQQLIKLNPREDQGLSTLLDLHDQILSQDGGYWIKIEAWVVEATERIPHGIRYSLTLHEPYGRRILGYDNAHPVKPSGKSSIREQGYLTTTDTDMPAIVECPMNLRMYTNCCLIFFWKQTAF